MEDIGLDGLLTLSEMQLTDILRTNNLKCSSSWAKPRLAEEIMEQLAEFDVRPEPELKMARLRCLIRQAICWTKCYATLAYCETCKDACIEDNSLRGDPIACSACKTVMGNVRDTIVRAFVVDVRADDQTEAGNDNVFDLRGLDQETRLIL
ncbi:uncharacterized protein LOC132202339 [Neocloeon triangulifer]|uniref:uncharacterized protein LOC132202339 n=1 Tax=Neocloeon triangulifer TaxID=2078957 RepID=UPI00286F1D06|nr:uncharacterized protein LOC132202339 [Neocloeon triangulifer]XP_059485171.1 uncharacterized protein LOC132202339 [Neocloeon triangulifer]